LSGNDDYKVTKKDLYNELLDSGVNDDDLEYDSNALKILEFLFPSTFKYNDKLKISGPTLRTNQTVTLKPAEVQPRPKSTHRKSSHRRSSSSRRHHHHHN